MQKAIYKRDFWDHIHGDELPFGAVFQVFDFAVKSGIRTAIKALQRAIGVVDDGTWGPATHDAALAMSQTDIIMRFVAERLDFWADLSTWPTFGRGWARRAAQDLRIGADDT